MPSQIHFVGYSFGALVGAVSAVSWAADRTASLTVIDTSFAAYPERHVADEWAEGSYLRWMFDYRSLLASLSRVVVIRAEASSVLPQAEVDRLTALETVEVVEVQGDHASILADTDRLASIIRDRVIASDLLP
jgi:pimeloyl-ACP methyl ester carboxylesterase